MRYFLKLAYDGKPFHGWQCQPNAVSVQQTIEEALSLIFRFPVQITGAGRTDTGVNARLMYAHFDLPHDIPDKNNVICSLNKLVGKAIAVYDIIEVSPKAHARFDAVSRTYKYFISSEKNPFLGNISLFLHRSLDIGIMNKCGKILCENDDFTSFAKLHSDSKTNICKVSEAFWEINSNIDFSLSPLLVFTISADRFLRNMVRAIVGTMLEAGMGKINEEGFREIIKKKDRCHAGVSVEPQGLFLWDIKYDFFNYMTKI